MTNSGTVLSLARRIVASVSLLSLGACCREVGRFDGSIAVTRNSPGVRFDDGGAVDDASCMTACQLRFISCDHNEHHSCSATTVDGGPGIFCDLTIYECPRQPFVACGRRTEGVDEVTATRARDTLGVFIALEAEAIAAFERLARELVALGAPEAMVQAARSCAEDERRHVAMVSALDGRTALQAPVARELPLRSAMDVALENAVEGCVRETFGVVIAQWQAEHSTNARVRACYAKIAADEARHAALAGEIDAWFAARSSEDERAKIEEAKRHAMNELRAEQPWAVGDPWLGTPNATVAKALVDALARATA
ncbi:MAG: ferritin-like domain-containing protein [Myxococcales bacterium]|nr:ferritin-like domain-containing protein [Myxococcales bacterium]